MYLQSKGGLRTQRGRRAEEDGGFTSVGGVYVLGSSALPGWVAELLCVAIMGSDTPV